MRTKSWRAFSRCARPLGVTECLPVPCVCPWRTAATACAAAAAAAAALHRTRLNALPLPPQLLEERDQLTSMSLERQQEVAEHDLVIKTLEPLEAERKCFRLVRYAALSVALLLSAADRSDAACNGAVHTGGRHASWASQASLCCVTAPPRSS